MTLIYQGFFNAQSLIALMLGHSTACCKSQKWLEDDTEKYFERLLFTAKR